MSSFGPNGISVSNEFRLTSTNIQTGYRQNLGFVGGTGSNEYTHVKTNITNNNVMIKFYLTGYAYGGADVESSASMYAYSDVSSAPIDVRSNFHSGSPYGLVNFYYSSDAKLVVVARLAQYSGGFLWAQSGKTHAKSDVEVLAFLGSSNSSTGY
jgi:hypothetical protein